MKHIAALPLALLAGCAGIVQQPADPVTTARIVVACKQSGLFKMVVGIGGRIALGPAGDLPASVINAGVDRVCADPERFSADISTVEWVVKNLRP